MVADWVGGGDGEVVDVVGTVVGWLLKVGWGFEIKLAAGGVDGEERGVSAINAIDQWVAVSVAGLGLVNAARAVLVDVDTNAVLSKDWGAASVVDQVDGEIEGAAIVGKIGGGDGQSVGDAAVAALELAKAG